MYLSKISKEMSKINHFFKKEKKEFLTFKFYLVYLPFEVLHIVYEFKS